MKTYLYWFAISALLLWIGWPPIPYSSPVLFVAFIPLLIGIEKIIRSDYKKKGRKIFWSSFLTLSVWNTASIYWVYNAMNAYLPAHISLLISLIPFTLGPFLLTASFWLYYAIRKRKSIYLGLIALPGFWILAEYLHQSWDLAFPWMSLGNGFANFHHIVQWYEFTGIYGGAVWIWVINILGFLIYLHYKKQIQLSKPKLMYSALGLIIVLPITASLLIYKQYEEHFNPSHIVVAQPNIDPYQKFGNIHPDEQLDILMRLSAEVAAPNTEFFIWPETAISSYEGINEEDFREYPAYQRMQEFLTNYKNGNILSGIESYRLYPSASTSSARPFGNQYIDYFNSSVLVDNSSKIQYYHKSKLVPGVEKLPFGESLNFLKPLFAHFGGTTGGYGSQKKPNAFYAESGIGAAPVICYESIWGNYVNRYVQEGAQFIAIVTNDGWWGNTSGKDQHLLYAKLRAIENRRWVARSANTGISAFINQTGDITQQSEWWMEDALAEEINLNEKLTFYAKHGDWIISLSTFASFLILISLFFKTSLFKKE